MPNLRIHGGVPLSGSVAVSGAKNASLPILAASLLADGPVVLDNIPYLTDVRTQRRVLSSLGVGSRRDEGGALRLETHDHSQCRAPLSLVRRMRASFCVLGPLLARRQAAVVALPGGCAIGPRPVDLHLKGLAALGAEIRVERGYVIAKARRLRGATISLLGPFGPTVTGTANVLSAAVLAEGETVINGAAREPEIVDLANFLIAMGARIEGHGTSRMRIEGVESLAGVKYRVIADRIEAATLLMAVAITGGRATIERVIPEHLEAVLKLLREAGAQVRIEGDRAIVDGSAARRPFEVETAPYPGLPTDVQAQAMALAALADGESTVRDTIFPHRLRHVGELMRMGAQIDCGSGAVRIRGVARLSPAPVEATDLRASAALVLAALATSGMTTVRGVRHLERGYERLDAKLRALGGDVQRISVSGKSVREPARLVAAARGA